jgi:hypothetical protein
VAKEILTDAKVTIASTDLGNLVTSVEISGDAETRDVTGFGDTHRTYLVGFKNWTARIDFHHDYADNNLNELLFSWWGTSQTIAIRKADTTIGTGNPEYQGSVIFTSVPLMNASVGEVSGGSITLQGTGTLTRAVSA